MVEGLHLSLQGADTVMYNVVVEVLILQPRKITKVANNRTNNDLQTYLEMRS